MYTQHQPLLFQTMESITKGRLRDVDYPFVGNHFQQGRSVASLLILFYVILPQEFLIFTWTDSNGTSTTLAHLTYLFLNPIFNLV